ncbi:hypothetical protein ACF1GY_36625 [Streptomyces sp. NPDC014684]|uniref:hypothetical protein n=1 Tax=Streptomyces sp. NPDC014684 TaxID=3364880 RepID=UPI0036FBCBA3
MEQAAPLGGRAGREMADLDACPDGADHFGQKHAQGAALPEVLLGELHAALTRHAAGDRPG